ncbi:MAG: LacI family transcriptional regulator [Chloroflexi bacterium]|nr:LacI family transcriptional regulator [Chloroflexota bacterium]
MNEPSRASDSQPSATIADVAELAGVSTATVSRVLSGHSRGRGDSRNRVLSAVRTLEYRPSSVARSLKLRTTHTLGLLITDIQNPFFPELVRAIEDRARSRGYVVLLGNGANDREREAAFLELLEARRVDGVLIATSGLTHRHARWLDSARLPTVLVNSETRDGSRPAAMSDNRAGGRLAAEHLLALGHRRLGLVTVSLDDPPAAERLAGLHLALDSPSAQGATVTLEHCESNVASGGSATARLLQANPDVTGILCYNDVVAFGALRAIRASGRSVPLDVSVVGFDDIALAGFAEPSLTTVAQDIPALGGWVVDRLLDSLAGQRERVVPSIYETVRLPVRLVVRATTAVAQRAITDG